MLMIKPCECAPTREQVVFIRLKEQLMTCLASYESLVNQT